LLYLEWPIHLIAQFMETRRRRRRRRRELQRL